MCILLDAVLAFFSCVGIWTLYQMIYAALFTDKTNHTKDCMMKEDKITWMRANRTIK